MANKSCNIGKTTTTNQYKRVPDLWRPGSVKIKRYYVKSGRLIPTAKRGGDQFAVQFLHSILVMGSSYPYKLFSLRHLKQVLIFF